MDMIIQKLSEIETASTGILEGAANQNRLLDEQQEKRIREYDEAVDRQTAAEIDALRAELSASMESGLKSLKESAESTLASMDQVYQSSHTEIADRIFRHIIGQENG